MNARQSRNLLDVLLEALTLNANLYEDANALTHSRLFAVVIVGLAAISHAIGSAFILLLNRAIWPILGVALLVDLIAVILGYFFWTWSIWKIAQWQRSRSLRYQDFLIPIGFAYAPQVLNVLTVIPLLGRPIEIGLALWGLLAAIAAVRHTLDVSFAKATVICGVGWVVVQVAIGFIQIFEQQLVTWL